MNGRRDFGIAMAEWNDGRQQIRETNYTAYSAMKMLAAIGIMAVIFDAFIPAAILFGVASVIGIINWR